MVLLNKDITLIYVEFMICIALSLRISFPKLPLYWVYLLSGSIQFTLDEHMGRGCNLIGGAPALHAARSQIPEDTLLKGPQVPVPEETCS